MTETEIRLLKRIQERRERRKLWAKFITMCVSILLVLVLTVVLIFTIRDYIRAKKTAEPAVPSETVQTPLAEAAVRIPVNRVPEQTVTLVAVGDNLMHNTVMWAGQNEDGGYDYRPLYEHLRPKVSAADIACVNQETIFINDPDEYTNYPEFGGPVEIGEALIDTGFDVVTHATNHCYDKGERGLDDTIAFWRAHPQITVLGIHDSKEDADTVRVVEKNGIRIAMLNYTYGTNASMPAQSYRIDFLWDAEKIAADIEKAREVSDIVIVFPHWGSENVFEPNENQREWAQFFADHGVGAVIGCHTHSLQPVEEITGADGNRMPVYWSLGNMISHMEHNWNMLGGMAELTIGKDAYGVFVADYSISPLMTFAAHDRGKWEFQSMPLEDYTEEMAARHLISDTSPKQMWALYEQIIPSVSNTP